MYIRSQNKSYLAHFNSGVLAENGTAIVLYMGSETYALGKYKNKEEVQAVLTEIEAALKDDTVIYQMPAGSI